MKRVSLGLFGSLGMCALAVVAACSSDSSDVAGGTDGGEFGSGAGNAGTSSGDPTPEAPQQIAPDPAKPVACETLDSSKPLVLYVSADDSNSMSSPIVAREMIRKGAFPTNSIRTYEFLNYYRIGYAAPESGTVALIPQLEAGAEAGQYDMQLGVRAFDPVTPRRPITVTFVLDTSGSMTGAGIERERAAVKAIAASLGKGDIVSMVTWNTSNNVVMSGHSVSGPNDAVLVATAESLEASGGTDLNSGLTSGYELAKKHYGAERMNRVVLISDGGANVGVTDEDIIAEHSKDADKEGIYLVGVGTGPADGYNDTLMDVVTDKGRGAYVYLDSIEEATHVFTDRFDEVMEVAARGVQVELTLPWYLQMYQFFGEEYSTDPNEIEPQHLAPGDAMIFNQVLAACDPSVVDVSDKIGIVARWQVPIVYQQKEIKMEISLKDLLAGPMGELRKGKAIVAYAEALKDGGTEALHAAHAAVIAANTSKIDPELAEIVMLLEKHPQF
jgi:Ca-activated chloride channel homolog